MASMLELCQDAADYVGIANPSSVIGETGQDARRLRACARTIAADIRTRLFPELLKAGSIAISAGVTEYTEDGDVYTYASESFWTSNDEFVAGSISPSEFQRLEQNGTVTLDPIFRLQQSTSGTPQRAIEIYPSPPTGGYTLFYLYYSTEVFRNVSDATIIEWTTDTDEVIVDDEIMRLGLIWTLLRSLRRNYQEEQSWYARYMRRAGAAGKIGTTINLARSVSHPIANTPEQGFG